ncbi:hypothetical protein D3C86_963990 [compost metagenome]
MGKAQGGFLGEVGDLDAPSRAVSDCRPHLGAGVPDDDADLADPRIPHRLDGVEQDRLVGHGDQLLGGGMGDGAQPRPFPTAQDQPFHGLLALSVVASPGPIGSSARISFIVGWARGWSKGGSLQGFLSFDLVSPCKGPHGEERREFSVRGSVSPFGSNPNNS